MTEYERYIRINENSPFYYVVGRDEEDGRLEFLGDITLLNDGTTIVNNDWEDIGNRYFDTHAEAIRYVETRMCDHPLYYDPEKRMFARIRVKEEAYA